MNGSPILVLQVEDDEEDYLLTRRLLVGNNRTAFKVKWVRTYDDALAELKNPYDACLVDYRLGGDSGLDLIEKAIAGGYSGPMILLTGQGDHDLDVEAMKAGAADYLAKDQITPQLIERVIRHAIERKIAAVALRESEAQLRQVQKMEAIGSLAGGVAHDFNNLLSVILSYSELLGFDLKHDDPMRADLSAINEAGLRAAALTQQLLAFSRQQVLQPVVIDLNEIFGGMEQMLRRVIGEDVELASMASEGICRVKVDPGQMEQVIMNLVVNARDAMPRGGKLTIETSEMFLDESYVADHRGTKVGPHIMLAVRDTGSGMTKAIQARIFEPFFTTKQPGKGTGLGLATVFGIIQQSGGAVWVDSEIGVGTTFNVYLPVAGQGDLDGTTSPAPERRTLRGSETILLVEDEERVRGLVRTILARYGYNVLEAQNAGDALLYCEQHPGAIDLLLTDVVMPRMSGPQLAERVRALRPRMKVLYMSGYTDDAVVLHGILDASIALIQKPITPGALARKVRDTLRVALRAAA